MCGKPKFGSDSVFKNQTVQTFYIHLDGYPTIHNSDKKWIKVTLLALNVQIKNVLKHNRMRGLQGQERG